MLMPVGPLFAILCLLLRRTAAMSTCNILFLFGLRLHLSAVRVPMLPTTPEVDAILQNQLEIVSFVHINLTFHVPLPWERFGVGD